MQEKSNDIWQNQKFYGYNLGGMLILVVQTLVMGYLLSSLIPLIAATLFTSLDIVCLVKLIKLSKQYKKIKAESLKLQKHLARRKIVINHKEYELNKCVIDEVTKNDCILENLNIEGLNIEQLKSLSIAGCGEETKKNTVETKDKRPNLTRSE